MATKYPVTTDQVEGAALEGPGRPGVVTFGFTGGDVVEDDTLTLGARIYVFKAGDGTGLNINMGKASPWSAAECITAVVSKVNADASREFDVLDMGSDTMGAVEKTVTGVAPSTAASRASVKVSAATARLSAAAAIAKRVVGQYVISANDVLALALGGGTGEVVIAAFPSATEPTMINLSARTSAGVFKSVATLKGVAAQFNTNFWGVKLTDAGAVLANGDILAIQVEI